MICAGRTPEQCHSGDRLDAPIQFSRIKPLKGEPMRFIFISKDLKIPISFIPDPVQSEDNGCKLNAVRLSAKFELALIEGMGFPPDAEVRLMNSNGESPEAVVILDDKGVSATADKSTGVVVKTDARGAIQATLLNKTTGSTTGSEVVQVIAPHCSPKIQYSWGVF